MSPRVTLLGTAFLATMLTTPVALQAQCPSSASGSSSSSSGASGLSGWGDAGTATSEWFGPAGAAGSGRSSARSGRMGLPSTATAASSRRSTVRGESERGGRGCAVTTSQLTFVPTQENWARWWTRQGDEFIWGRDRAVSHRLTESEAARTASRGAPLSNARQEALVDAGHAPLRRAYVQTRVVLPLLDVIEDDQEDTVLREAAIRTLGSAVDPRFAGVVTDVLVPQLDDDEERIRSAAALALGVAGDPDAVPTLRELAYCSKAGHKLVGETEVSRRVRTAALLGLGFADAPESYAALADTIVSLPDSEVEMKRAAIMSLGLLGEQRADHARALLVELLEDPTLADLLKAEVPPALARLGSRDAVPALADALVSPRTERLVRQSAAVALGRLASIHDEDVVNALLDTLVDDRDEATRNFAAIAVARLGAADERPEERDELHAAVARRLEKQLWRPEHRRDGPFHALAAGLYLQAHPGRAPQLRERLVRAFDEVSDPSIRGAYALALGMAGDRSAGDPLREAFRDVKDPVFRAHCALGLGLLGDEASADDLLAAVDEKSLPTTLRHALGAGLMLLDDERAADELVEAFGEAGSQEHRSGLALALASHRHEQVVPSLVEALRDDSLDDGSRVAACAALAGVTERSQLPWRAALALDSNFETSTPTVDDVLGMP